ncbi:uncharacterized protein Z518_10626 [Rhinocladiella mackenziei CBS 650.93]|uniref:Uncharacterized protein n=1 Tax=Rhinocladiella mackenziei CBS 650.93 TaxID=1442369 RepID=A0A0D2IB21_9EURO|nr:uncharacterized protein Z518_10626 [Rhinocladiella mackenziei CBS 650.93]KIX00486.1 hypothetical protein Z518_10626 [Rhinocladiella mackenziei CBS 650.93]
MSVTIYIIYNNSASFLGRIGYGIRRLSTTPETPSACAATDLTHGGAHPHEKPEWIATKKKIPADIKQVHYDELPPDVKKYVESNRYKYPCIVGKGPDGRFRMLLIDYEIEEVSDNCNKFLQVLKTKFQQSGLPWDYSSIQPTSAA